MGNIKPVVVVTGASRGAGCGSLRLSYRDTHHIEPRVQYPYVIR
jgi:hypothetical protein